MEEIIKSKKTDAVPGIPCEDEVRLISAFTRSEPDPESIYTFSVTLCDNETDRDFERFSLNALKKLSEMFVGVTGIFDHDPKSQNQTARIYKTELITDNTKKTASGEDYVYIKAWCYMLRTKKNADLINEIEGGIKKEISVSCAVSSVICSECGKDIRKSECPHTPGQNIGGHICHGILDEPTDAYEWSFVAIPAQRNAGVSKSFSKKQSAKIRPEFARIDNDGDIEKAFSSAEHGLSITAEQADIISEYIRKMKTEADAGRNVRVSKEKDIIASAAFTLPEADTFVLAGILKKLDDTEINMLQKAFFSKGHDMEITKPSFSENFRKITDDSQFKI